MSTGAVDLALRRAAQDALRSEAGVLVLKLNRRVHPLTRRREFVPRAIRVDTATSSPRLIYFSPSDALSDKKRRVFALHAVRFGVLEDDHDRVSRSLTFTLSNESESKERRRLDVVFSDVSTAINSFLAVQSLTLTRSTEKRESNFNGRSHSFKCPRCSVRRRSVVRKIMRLLSSSPCLRTYRKRSVLQHRRDAEIRIVLRWPDIRVRYIRYHFLPRTNAYDVSSPRSNIVRI